MSSPIDNPAVGATAPAGQRKALAVVSLILGILAVLCFQFVAGVPAVILGHVAHRRATRDPSHYGGRRMAVAGCILGYTSFCTTILIAMLLSSLVRSTVLETYCVSNLKQIDLAMRAYAKENKDVLPDTFMNMTNDLPSPRLLVCPSDSKHRVPDVEWPPWDPDNISYVLLCSGIPLTEVGSNVVVRCPVHKLNLLGDGTVQRDQKARTTADQRTRGTQGK